MLNRSEHNTVFCERARELFGLMRQQRLSEITGVTQSTISKIKSDKTDYKPTADTICRIAKAFNVSTDYLLGFTDDKNTIKATADTGIKVMLDEGAKMPTRAHITDAGLDIYARDEQIVPAKESAIFDTGVHIELPIDTVGMLKSKSGLNVKYGITSEGVIDVGYTGSIVVKLYNNSGFDYRVKKGDKITQLVILPIITPTPYLVESLEETERGDNGFGSSGR